VCVSLISMDRFCLLLMFYGPKSHLLGHHTYLGFPRPAGEEPIYGEHTFFTATHGRQLRTVRTHRPHVLASNVRKKTWSSTQYRTNAFTRGRARSSTNRRKQHESRIDKDLDGWMDDGLTDRSVGQCSSVQHVRLVGGERLELADGDALLGQPGVALERAGLLAALGAGVLPALAGALPVHARDPRPDAQLHALADAVLPGLRARRRVHRQYHRQRHHGEHRHRRRRPRHASNGGGGRSRRRRAYGARAAGPPAGQVRSGLGRRWLSRRRCDVSTRVVSDPSSPARLLLPLFNWL
jgi:hypothetical protein